jgi:putative flippase GtrA
LIEMPEIDTEDPFEIDPAVQPSRSERKAGAHRSRTLRQMLRFSLVGGVNTVVDLLFLNSLLLLFPTTSALMLLLYNSLAYSLGALNSFLLNKFWTFGHRQPTTRRELGRFILTTLGGIVWSNSILWLASSVLHPLLINPTLWANASKVFAIAGTACISYLGMRLWVFVSKGQKEQTSSFSRTLQHTTVTDKQRALPALCGDLGACMQSMASEKRERPACKHSLSVVLPAYNEEQVIASSVCDVVGVLSAWQLDFEVLVVNDGSSDRTGAIVAELVLAHPEVHLITHRTNQGYGAALVSGFAAASKELTFFMDSDGQFNIRGLERFFPFIDEYDAVIGYRLNRQDSWMRSCNAWGWKWLIGWTLGVHVRDIDCAFKLLHTKFLHDYPLETRGAMINAELLYKLTQAGCNYREIGIPHYPRQGGRATGARPRVILRALRELFVSAHRWHQQEHASQPVARKLPIRSRVR